MDETTTRVIVQEIFRAWGPFALFAVVGSAMTAAAVAQILQLRKWKPELTPVVEELRKIVAKLDTQHATCTRHYDYAQKQIEGMGSISHELRAVVESIADSDKSRTAEILQLMTVIAGRRDR